MLGIVLLHAIHWSRYNQPMWLEYVLRSCVDAFLIISGWFGIRFSPSKILKLLGVLLYAFGFDLLTQVVFDVFQGPGAFVKQYITNPWFLYAYFVVMLVAPIIDVLFEKLEKKQLIATLVPFFILLLWSCATNMPYLQTIMPITPGLGSYTPLTLVGCYIIGRLARYFTLEKCLSVRCLYAFLLVGICGAACGLGFYASPFAMLIGLTTFLLFRRISIPNWLSSLSLFLGPSMFAIYVLHRVRVLNGGRLAIGFIQELQTFLFETCHVSSYVLFLCSALIWFCVAFTLDMPRRFFVWCFKKSIMRVLKGVDRCYQDILDV